MVLLPLAVVTVTSTVPLPLPGGDTTTIEVADSTVKLVAFFDPTPTAVAPPRLVPVILIWTPPVSGPLLGVTALMVGGSGW